MVNVLHKLWPLATGRQHRWAPVEAGNWSPATGRGPVPVWCHVSGGQPGERQLQRDRKAGAGWGDFFGV